MMFIEFKEYGINRFDSKRVLIPKESILKIYDCEDSSLVITEDSKIYTVEKFEEIKKLLED